jgi:hypothetical protein
VDGLADIPEFPIGRITVNLAHADERTVESGKPAVLTVGAAPPLWLSP